MARLSFNCFALLVSTWRLTLLSGLAELIGNPFGTDMPRPWDGVKIGEDLSGDPGSEEALSRMRQWVSTCEQAHPRCHQERSFLPKRLLAIGEVGATHVYLWEPEKGSSARYAALSYCWGGEDGIKTTTANKERMKAGIALDDIPLTMRHAIDIAQKLNIYHLWIDALCILQDSMADWEIESSHMAPIYQNAYLTIAADASSSSSQGIYGVREEAQVQVTTWTNEQGLETIVKSRVMDPSEHVAHQAQAPLKGRGWALQEDVLSNRLLTFGLHELQWRCREVHTCECRFCEFGSVALPPIFTLETSHDATKAWYLYAMAYSRRSLTHTHDRLPALSGIASILQIFTRWHYLAGIWFENCSEELAWKLEGSTPSIPCDAYAPADSRLPTFSWLSVVDRTMVRNAYKHVVYHKDLNDDASVPEIVPHSWNCRSLGQNPFGLVTDAWIAVQGYLTPAQLRTTQKVSAVELASEDLEPMYVVQFAEREEAFKPDVFIEETTLYFAADGTPARTAHRAHPPAQAESHFARYFSRVDVPVMLLSLCRNVEAGQNGRGYRSYLVLAKSARQPGCFERLGVLEVSYGSASEWPSVPDSSLWTTVTLV